MKVVLALFYSLLAGLACFRFYFLSGQIQAQKNLCSQSWGTFVGTPTLQNPENAYLDGDFFYPIKIPLIAPEFYRAYQIKIQGPLLCSLGYQNPSREGEVRMKIKEIKSVQILDSSSFFIRTQKYFFDWVSEKVKKYPMVESFTIAVWVGRVEGLSENFKKFYIEAGAMQIIALSGQHVSIFVFLILFFFRNFSYSVRKYIPLFCCLILLWSSLMAASVQRTFAMLLAAFILKSRGYYSHPFKIVFVSSFLLFLYDPPLIFNMGFFLSVFCTLLLCALLEIKNKQQFFFVLALHFAMPILVMPLTAHLFSKVSLLSVVCNFVLNFFWEFIIIPFCFLMPLGLMVLPNFLLSFLLDKVNFLFFKFVSLHEYFFSFVEKSYWTVWSPNILEVIFLEGIMLGIIYKIYRFFMMRHS
jgi:ComEC/Rec2-related protein